LVLCYESNALNALKIGVSAAVGFCGTVRLPVGYIEGIDKGDIVSYKRSRAAMGGALKVNGNLTNEESGARGL
jgi:hypothetical protein